MSGTDSDCHVKVVAAGVHVAVGRRIVESGVFFDGKCIHVCSKQHGWARLPTLDVQHDARKFVAQVNFTEAVNRGKNALAGFWKVETKLGNLVQVAANPLNNL